MIAGVDRPDFTVLDQRKVAPGRVRSLLRSIERERTVRVRWYVAELDRIVDCGHDWNRAAELLAAEELPTRST
jgi:hypothetical protein